MSRLIRRDDFWLFLEKSRSVGIRRLLAKILRGDRARVEESWSHVTSERSSWWDLDDVMKRWNRLITGDSDVDYQEYVAKKFFRGRKELRAISIGCGTGRKEIGWAATKKFSSITGYDISKSRIQIAQELARRSKWKGRLKFEVGDVHALQFPPASFDVVIFDNSLHHCSPLQPVVDKANQWLSEKGFVVVNEYVGPDRFQWTDKQVALTNALLQVLPERLRRKKDGKLKNRMTRPGALAVRLNDPSEAAESSAILNSLQRRFAVLEVRPYGGTILANLLKDIAHNFSDHTRETRDWLEFLFGVEDRLMEEKVLPSDYVFGVYGKQKHRETSKRN